MLSNNGAGIAYNAQIAAITSITTTLGTGTVTLVSGNYQLPVAAGRVQLDCPITRGPRSNSTEDLWGLVADARIRLWPAGSPLIDPASFVYPAMAIVQGGLGAQHLAAVFVGLSLHAIALASIGLACSAWTGSQLVAAVAGWALGFVIWDFEWVKSFRFVGETGSRLLDALSLHLHYGSFAEGIIGAAHLAYFVALAALTFAVAKLAFLWRRVAG